MSQPGDVDREAPNLLFAGPGEMRALCRDFDWSATGMGSVDRWPLSLRTIVATLLSSRHPMFLFWGPELVQFYNDAYRPSLGGGDRHPAALGMRAADFWKEIWDVIGPQIDHVVAGGEATWHEDQYLPIERNGNLEDVWWTYSYSAAFADDGNVGGVLVVCQETTARVRTEQHLKELTDSLTGEAARLKGLLDGSPAVMALFSGPEHVITYVNPTWERVVGKSGCLGLPVREVFPEMIKSGIFNRLDEVYSTGQPSTAREMELPLRREPDQPVETDYWNLAWIPVPRSSTTDSGGDGPDILVHAVEVSEQVLARREVERLLDDSNKARQEAEEARNAVMDAERQFETFVDAIPALAWTARADGYIDWYNARWYEYTGTTPEDMEGWGWTSVHDAQALPAVLDRWEASIASGKPFEMTFPLRGK
ncbi:MAG: PAS domain-containing protein, partial [Gemmatimonadaceae bacterium]